MVPLPRRGERRRSLDVTSADKRLAGDETAAGALATTPLRRSDTVPYWSSRSCRP
jgi:hypothetical protein